MKLHYVFAFCLLALALASKVQARPVSYARGWTVMQKNDFNSSSLHVHYSPTAIYSIGYRGEYFKDEHWQWHGVQLNYLLNRWNKQGSQANIYLKTGLGAAYSDQQPFQGKTALGGFIGLAADWETRRYFVSYENRYVYAQPIEDLFNQKARVGFAPYIGDYGALHTWLMLQVEHNPMQTNKMTYTPLVRFFKGAYLVEAGINHRGEMLFNWIVRF